MISEITETTTKNKLKKKKKQRQKNTRFKNEFCVLNNKNKA